MKQCAIVVLLCLLSVAGLQAQKITGKKTMKVAYPLAQVGYPSRLLPADDNGFTYMEFWNEREDYRFSNHFLQSYNKKYEEQWYRPVTAKEAPKFEDFVNVYRLNDAYAVVGHQYSPAIKRAATKMQLVTLNGKERGTITTISQLTKKEKGYQDEIVLSPDQSKMLWLGHNPQASAKKRGFFASVHDSKGTKIWGKKLLLPPSSEKYLVKQVLVDNRGNAYFYMVFETVTNTAKDTLFRPVIARYDHRESKVLLHSLDVPRASVPQGMLHITQKGDLAFLGILADGSAGGFTNGAKVFNGVGMKWNKLMFKLFNIERELQLSQEYTMDFPKSWLDRYGSRGADFSEAEIIESGDDLYWVMEEHYTQIHQDQLQHLYYDVAVVGISTKTGQIRWANTFEKKQRDYKNGHLLSYCAGVAAGKLRFVYLNEKGAQGKVVCTSMSLQDGSTETVVLASDENADMMFFPKRSAMIGPDRMLLMGVGNPVGNEYALIEVTFK
jgi:hypothetical protein